MDPPAGGSGCYNPPISVSVDEFRWNLKRLVREGFPDGIAVNQVEELYRFWLGRTIRPWMLDPTAADWISVFQGSAVLKLHFKLSKRNDGIYVIKLRKGPELSPVELTEVLQLANYSCLMRMRAAMANGRSERPRSPDSTLASAVTSQSTSSSASHVQVANHGDSFNQNTSASQDLEGSQSVQEIISALENSMLPPAISQSADNDNTSSTIVAATDNSQSVSPADLGVLVTTENVSVVVADEEELPLLDSGSSSSSVLPSPFLVDMKVEVAAANEDPYPGPPSNSSATTTLMEQDDNRLAEVEEVAGGGTEQVHSSLDTAVSVTETESQTSLHAGDDQSLSQSQDSLICDNERPGTSSSGTNMKLRKRLPPVLTVDLSPSQSKRPKCLESQAVLSSSGNPEVEVDNFSTRFSGLKELFLNQFQYLDAVMRKEFLPQTMEIPTEWMAFPVQNDPFEDKVSNRGLYKCGEDGITLRFGRNCHWEVPKYVCCQKAKLRLPPKTLVYGEFVDYFVSSRQTRTVFHVIDVAILNDRFIYYESFHSRRNAAAEFFAPFGVSRDVSKVAIKLKPAVKLHCIQTEIIDRLIAQQDQDGRTTYVLKETPLLDVNMPNFNLPYFQITGLLLLPAETNMEAATFIHAIQSRLFWQWRSQLSLSAERILFDEEEDEVCLWHFREHFEITGASDLPK